MFLLNTRIPTKIRLGPRVGADHFSPLPALESRERWWIPGAKAPEALEKVLAVPEDRLYPSPKRFLW